MRKRFLFIGGLGLALSVGVLMGQSAGQPAKPEPPSAAPRLAAAERVCEMLHHQMDGSRRYHASAEEAYIWSKRRMEAQCDAENARGGDRVAALQAHLQRMRDLEAQYAGFYKDQAASRLELESTHFYVAEAEELLARERAK